MVAVVLALLIDNLVLNLSAGNSLGTSLGFTLANALEPLVVATTYTRLRRRWPEVTVAMPLLVIAALYVLINFAIDLLYAVVDPRVKAG